MPNVMKVLRGPGRAGGAEARPAREPRSGNLPCVGDVIRENTRLRAAAHRLEVELAAARARQADLEARLDAAEKRAALAGTGARHARR